MNNYTRLEKAILKTVCWFDVFDQPMSLFEIWRCLYWPFLGSPGAPAPGHSYGRAGARAPALPDEVNISDIQEILENSEELKKIIDFKQGYYFLKSNNKDLVKTRTERYNVAEQKFKKARRIIKILARFPFVRMIAICNTLAYRGADESSDIDLFVVTEKNRIWWTRFFLLSFLSIFNLRPRKDDFKNKFCLSFFIDTESLNIKNVSKDYDDIYLIYWTDQLLPIYNDNIYAKFYQANSWIKDYLPFSEQKIVNQRLTIKLGFFSKLIKKIWQGKINLLAGDFSEKLLKKWQIKKLPPELKNKANKSTDVVIQEGIAKFHLNDRRGEFHKSWQKKLEEIEHRFN